MKYLYVNKI